MLHLKWIIILVKHGLFPFTVLREEAKVKYIDALEKADNGEPQPLVGYFAEVQKRHIEKALNLKEVSSTSFEDVADIFSGKLENWEKTKINDRENLLKNARSKVYECCLTSLNEIKLILNKKLNGNTNISIESCPPSDIGRQHSYYGQMIKYAKKIIITSTGVIDNIDISWNSFQLPKRGL